MNWLAHTLLSTPSVEFQLGNLLADLVRGDDRLLVSEEFLRGAACHKAIDAFTDSHDIVRRSRARVSDDYRRFSGVLMDVFYDYLLAKNWSRFCDRTLTEFTAQFYEAVRTTNATFPEPAQLTLDRIVTHDSLGSYRDIKGVERALHRISTYLTSRWRKPFALERSIPHLLDQEPAFSADFLEFFPQLRTHVRDWIREHP